MGVDYSPVAGFSIKMNSEIERHIGELADEKRPNWEKDYETAFDALGIKYAETGSSWTGDVEYIPLFVPEDAIDLDKQIAEWLKDLNEKLQTSFEIEDVIFFKDLRIS